jgi:hypothetical protein
LWLSSRRVVVFALYLKLQSAVAAIYAHGKEKIPSKMTINQVHAKFGFCSEAITCSSDPQLNVKFL